MNATPKESRLPPRHSKVMSIDAQVWGSNNSLVVQEIFYSIQGEGMRSGTSNVFIRLAGCNMKCAMAEGPRSPGGFVCDTDFSHGKKLTLSEIRWEIDRITAGFDCMAIVWTGGEPALQLTPSITGHFHEAGFHQAIETNGTVDVGPLALNWVTVSPKVPNEELKCLRADEVKYVRALHQPIPKNIIGDRYCDHRDSEAYCKPVQLLSPAWPVDGIGRPNGLNMSWCVQLVKENPEWRLSLQIHKILGVR